VVTSASPSIVVAQDAARLTIRGSHLRLPCTIAIGSSARCLGATVSVDGAELEWSRARRCWWWLTWRARQTTELTISLARACSTVPASLAEGIYNLTITNPDGAEVTLPSAITVTSLYPGRKTAATRHFGTCVHGPLPLFLSRNQGESSPSRR